MSRRTFCGRNGFNRLPYKLVEEPSGFALASIAYRDDVPVAADAADRVGGGAGGGEVGLLFLLALVLLLCGLVALVGAGVALAVLRVGHQVDEALQRRAELPLFVFLEAVIQSFVDHNPQGVDNLPGTRQGGRFESLFCQTNKSTFLSDFNPKQAALLMFSGFLFLFWL